MVHFAGVQLFHISLDRVRPYLEVSVLRKVRGGVTSLDGFSSSINEVESYSAAVALYIG